MPAEKLIQFPQSRPRKTRRALHSSGLVPLHFRYIDLQGVSRQKTVYGATEQEAQRKKKDFLGAVDACLRVDEQGKTVSAWLDEWVDTYKKPNVSAKRLQAIGYEVNRIKKAIGYLSLKSVTQSALQKIVNERAGKSGDTIRETASTIKAVFKSAVENRLIQFSPAIGLTMPKGKDGTHRALSDNEVDVIIKAAQTHRFGTAVMLMLFAGLRRGEAAAFNVDTDVDFVKNTLTISRSVGYVVNQGETKETKSGKARTVPIFPPLLPYLKKGYAIKREGDNALSLTALRRAYGSFLYECEKIVNGCSKRWQPDKHVWQSFDFRCHDLRHTFATMLYDAGVDVKTAQLWMGHSTPALTMKIYTHLSTSRQTASVQAAENYFAGCKFGNIDEKQTAKSESAQGTKGV